jgi:hypothetical protein
VVDLGAADEPTLRLDAGPLDAEAVGVQPEVGGDPDVLAVAVVAVGRVAGGLDDRGVRLLTLLPSIWWAAVAAPQRKPSGKCSVVMMVPFRAC